MGSYLLLVTLLHIPAFQRFIGNQIENVLAEKLGTKVEVGQVNLGFLNRVIIDDVLIYDQMNKKMLTASRLSAKFDIVPLLEGRISVSSAQIFGLKANLYKKDAKSKNNFQFVLDSLASKEQKESKLDLNINSLVIRNGSVKYDQWDIPSTNNRLNLSHLDISGISGHAMLDKLTGDSLKLRLKRLEFKEKSGLDIRSLAFDLNASRHSASLKNFRLSLPRSQVNIPHLIAQYEFAGKQIDLNSIVLDGSIDNTDIQLADLTFFERRLQSFNDRISLSATFQGTSKSFNLKQLNINSEKRNIHLVANGYIKDLKSSPQWTANITDLSMSANGIQTIANNFNTKTVSIPIQIVRMGNFNYRGKLARNGHYFSANGVLKTDAGNADFDFKIHETDFSGKLISNGIDLQRILDDGHFGMLATNIKIEGKLPQKPSYIPSYFKADGNITRLDYNSYSYNNIHIDGIFHNKTFTGKFGFNDVNGTVELNGDINLSSSVPSACLTAKVSQFNPSAMHITDKLASKTFDFDLKTDIKGLSLQQLSGNIDLQNFTMHSPEGSYRLDNLKIRTGKEESNHFITMESDFGTAVIHGQYDYSTLKQSITNLIKDKLPTLPGLPSTTRTCRNDFDIHAKILKTDWLQLFAKTDLQLQRPLIMDGKINDQQHFINLVCQMPAFTYQGNSYEDGMIAIKTIGDTLKAEGMLKKMKDDGKSFDLSLNAAAIDNHLTSNIAFNNHGEKRRLYGSLSLDTRFFRSERGTPSAHMIVHPSQIFINETPWEVEPSDIIYTDNKLIIDHFSVGNGEQNIVVAGIATKNTEDTVAIHLNKVDVEYLSGLLAVKSVEFGGKMSGDAYLTSVFDKTTATAQLNVDSFTFVDGRLGTLYVNADWNKHNNKININGLTDDGPFANMRILGDISLSPGHLNLNLNLANTRIEFLETFLKSTVCDVEARATGNLHIFGPLKNINLEGSVVANGDIGIKSLNTVYTMRNDTVRLFPNHIQFRADSVFDKNGHSAVINGDVRHQSLKNWSYGIDIEMENVLAYDFKDFGENTFCGKIYATGNCSINGHDDEITIEINATPEPNSILKYDVSGPDQLKKQEFIRWNDVTEERKLIFSENSPKGSRFPLPTLLVSGNSSRVQKPLRSISSNLYINFFINTTPDLTLRLIMNAETGDYIDLNGNGTLRATYFNKGAFNIFGNYLVDHGIYKMTIQNVIKKDFQFQEGSSIVFGGDAYNAALDLKALYVVNGVSLSDLKIGRSFATNNIRVNCIMNIKGTPNEPNVDFDLELPTVSADAQQMVRSLINSEEELNQQVIYLLTIGRFYAQEGNNAGQEFASQSQTSLAMQSLLSGTISQQVNSMLSSMLNTSNWNFGANISTGDEGWNNAEYEGILSGRLLNNRLLINGQFGYRDNANATTSFIGDFDVRYLLFPNGNLAVKVYNQTNDRYFTRNSLNTQGIGLVIKKDFNNLKDLFGKERKTKRSKIQQSEPADTLKNKENNGK